MASCSARNIPQLMKILLVACCQREERVAVVESGAGGPAA